MNLRKRCALAALALLAFAGLVEGADAAQMRHAPIGPTLHPQLYWAPIGHPPLSDGEAAALVTPEPEVRSGNARYNNYRPTNADLRAFYTTRDPHNHTPAQQNHWYAYVTGRSHLFHPSTDMLIQWAAHKWGIPEDTLRAIAQQETWWSEPDPGDLEKVSKRWYYQYPPAARAGHGRVYESMGIMQIRWRPDNSVNTGTGKLRWVSTAFNLDYAAATIRSYFDGRCGWCGRKYHAGDVWASVGSWNASRPSMNPKARAYIGRIKLRLSNHLWTSPWF